MDVSHALHSWIHWSLALKIPVKLNCAVALSSRTAEIGMICIHHLIRAILDFCNSLHFLGKRAQASNRLWWLRCAEPCRSFCQATPNAIQCIRLNMDERTEPSPAECEPRLRGFFRRHEKGQSGSHHGELPRIILGKISCGLHWPEDGWTGCQGYLICWRFPGWIGGYALPRMVSALLLALAHLPLAQHSYASDHVFPYRLWPLSQHAPILPLPLAHFTICLWYKSRGRTFLLE